MPFSSNSKKKSLSNLFSGCENSMHLTDSQSTRSNPLFTYIQNVVWIHHTNKYPKPFTCDALKRCVSTRFTSSLNGKCLVWSLLTKMTEYTLRNNKLTGAFPSKCRYLYYKCKKVNVKIIDMNMVFYFMPSSVSREEKSLHIELWWVIEWEKGFEIIVKMSQFI